jgi:hypothetical protein
MPDYKVSLFFTMGRQGWSEHYYQTGNDPVSVRALALNLVKARGGMLTASTRIPYVRVSDEAIAGDARVTTNPAFSPIVGAVPIIGDLAWTGMLVRMEATDIYRRSMILRGIPDNVADASNPDGPLVGDLLERFNVYRDRLKNDTWQMRATNRGVGFERKRVISVSFSNVTHALTLTVNAHGYAQGDQIRLSNFRLNPKLNRVFFVDVVTAVNSFAVIVPELQDWDPLKYSGTAFVRKHGVLYPDIAETSFVRFSKRDTGRPFGLTRGRARAR